MVGLTGGIGAGKSAVAARLAERGAVIIDADRLAREVVAPGTDGLAEVVAAFGAGVLGPDGALDRPALGRRVFGDEAARRRLEAIIHPRVRARTAELATAAARRRDRRQRRAAARRGGLAPLVPAGRRGRGGRADADPAAGRDPGHEPASRPRARIAAQADDDAAPAVAPTW